MSSLQTPPPTPPPTDRPFPAIELPELPMIRSTDIRFEVFTHRSVRSVSKNPFESVPGGLDNERLSNLGDTIFSLVLTDSIRECYPNLAVGPSSKIRDHVKSSTAPVDIAVGYGLHECLRVSDHQAHVLRSLTKVQVAVLKAYVGGLYKDSQENVEVIKKWLFPILCPYIKVAYQHQHRRYLQDPGRGISAQPTAARDTESLPLATSRSACYSSRAEDRSSSTARDHASPVLDEKKTLCSVVKSKAGPRRPRSSPKPPSPAGSNSTSGRYRRSKKSAAPEYPPTRPARSFTSVSSGEP